MFNVSTKSKHLRFSSKPIEFSLVSALKSCSSSSFSSSGQLLHALALKSGLESSNIFVRKALINLYTKCGLLGDAHFLFSSSASLDTASYNTMLVNYVKSHKSDKARNLFDEMTQRDCVSFTTMIVGLAQNGFSAGALLLFSQMVGDGVRPNEVTLATVLSSCACLCRDLGKMVHGIAKKTGLDGFVLVGTNLVNWYGVSSDLEDTRKVFDETPERNTVTWNG